MVRLLLFGVAFWLTMLGSPAATPAAAQAVRCASHASIVARLGEAFGERRIGVGLDGGGHLVELLVAANGSWTLLRSAPGGPTCIVAAGTAWQDERAPLGDAVRHEVPSDRS